MGKETKDDYDDMDAGAAHQEMTGEAKWLSTNEAKAANEAEHAVGFWKSIRQNRPAVLWSLLISTSVIMEGYDTSLMPNFPAYPSFRRHYGSFYPNLGDDGQGDYQLSSAWQAGLVNASNCGVIIGGFINGWASARFGYRRTMVVSMVFMAAFLFVVFFSPNNAVLCVGQILCGIPWGIFATTGPAYASEVLPLALRGYLTVYINLCWAAGQLLAAGILKGLVNNQTQWSYRIPWAIQWIWPPLLVVGCVFAPESPWWLVKNGRLAEAEKTLHRLAHRTDDEVRGTLSQMLHTIQVESELESGGSYLGCFKGTDLRRTEICCFTFMTQMLSGAQFAYGPAYFFEQAGMSTGDAYKVGLGGTALAFVGTMCSWLLLAYVGRRTIYLTGIATLTTTLIVIGIIAATSNAEGALWAQASLCLVWQLVYALTVGPICYAIISETSAIQLRAHTVVLARNSYNLTAIWCAVLEPYMINPTAWNWKGKTAFFWAGTSAVMTTWVYFRLPECKDRTYEELDLLFAHKVPARKFKNATVDPYAEHGGAVRY